ncbi:VWA domain-containing protein [Aquincola tertiaricarbonis]|uniref:VWA domain-containing protein n=1 Tax=Aquincola tertiaricarbonis TaxID=391953 RepID=A0ABY4SEZ8_AQUTE|nr:VWA domain-containing protein [Aquincola tertiaricarbonis]URI10323.1 VWA domain-containing protein [Aquincola tertiaricarbonis]
MHRLAENVMHFGRVLRQAGVPVGTDRIQLALQALQVAGLESRVDFRAALAACLLDRHEHRAMFDQAFDLYWRDPDLAGRMMQMLLPQVRANNANAPPPPPENRRLGEAFSANAPPRPPQPEPPEEVQVEATLTFSERELLQRADFDTMSPDEWLQAKRALRRMKPLFEPVATRRTRPAARPGRADWRATLQAMARQGGDLLQPRWRAPRARPAPLVVLADISGSMSRYSRMLLHFTHTLARADVRVESFVFGTRLTRTTHLLRQRDPDLAVAQVVRAVQDWSGGTRISACLHQFNQQWARRTLSGRATVLLVTDGLEHGHTEALRFEMERLHKSCRRLVWLNPLLRWQGFEPKAAGIRTMLPHVDRFVPAHNLDSLEQLTRLLADDTPAGRH